MDLTELERQLRESFLSLDVPEPLNRSRVTVRPLLNYGGLAD